MHLFTLILRGAAYADLLQHTGAPFKRVEWHDRPDIRLQYTLQYTGAQLKRVGWPWARNAKLMPICLRGSAYAGLLPRSCLRGLLTPVCLRVDAYALTLAR